MFADFIYRAPRLRAEREPAEPGEGGVAVSARGLSLSADGHRLTVRLSPGEMAGLGMLMYEFGRDAGGGFADLERFAGAVKAEAAHGG